MATLSQGQQPGPGMRPVLPYDPNLALTYDPHAHQQGRPVAVAPAGPDRRARFVTDMLDTTLIGAAYARSPNRRRLSAFAAVAAGVVVLDARTAEAGQPPR